jgi:hypothetical protein
LEQQLLLKEVRIGRRSQELPSWTGVVSAITCSEQNARQGGRASELRTSAQAGAADRDDVSPHADQDVQQCWEEPDPKKESDGAAKMRERPQEEHAEKSDWFGTLFKSVKARVFAKCPVKVAAHHIGVDTESGHRRKLRFIVYSGAPVGSYPIPRNLDEVRKDPASSRNTFVPMLRGFFMYQNSQVQEEVVLRDGLEFTIQVQGEKNGVVKSSAAEWAHKGSIDYREVEIDVHDIDLDSELEVKISSMGWAGGIREFTLKREHCSRNVLPGEWETCTSIMYWCNLDEYRGQQKSITCGYCLSCNEQQSEKVLVKGLGAGIKLGVCCKIVKNQLMGLSY